MVTFDPVVSWGTILTLVAVVVSVVVAYQRSAASRKVEVAKLERQLTRLEMKMNILWSTWRREHSVRPGDDDEFFNGEK